jgi:hypothetical protein
MPPATVASVRDNAAGTVQVDGPDVALPQSGAVVVWAVSRTANQESEAPVAGRIDAAVQQPDGSFSAPVKLTPGREIPTWSLSVAATRSAAVALWATGPYDRQRLRYAIRTDAWTPATTLATGANRGVSVAAAGDHAIAAGWTAPRFVLPSWVDARAANPSRAARSRSPSRRKSSACVNAEQRLAERLGEDVDAEPGAGRRGAAPVG